MSTNDILKRERKNVHKDAKVKLLKAVQYKVKDQTITILHLFIKTPTKEWTNVKADGKFYCYRKMVVAVDGEVQFSTYTKQWWRDK